MAMRQIDSKLWESEPFKSLHIEAKIVYLYLRTHPRINRKGSIPMGIGELVGGADQALRGCSSPYLGQVLVSTEEESELAFRRWMLRTIEGLCEVGLATVDSLTTVVSVAGAQKEVKPAPAGERLPYAEIIADLNEVCRKRHLVTEPTKRKIRARWADGFRLEDFKAVHRRMVDAADRGVWYTGKDMHDYLRPETLYSEKFEMYLTRNWEIRAHEGDQMDAWARGGE